MVSLKTSLLLVSFNQKINPRFRKEAFLFVQFSVFSPLTYKDIYVILKEKNIMQQTTVLYTSYCEDIRKNLDDRPSSSWVIIDEKSLSENDRLYLEGLTDEAQKKAKLGRIRRHYTDALSKKIQLIVVDVNVLDEDLARMYWSDSTISYAAINLIANKIKFPENDGRKKTYFVSSPSLNEFQSFCELLIADLTQANQLERKDKEKFISYLNSSNEFLMLYNNDYTAEEKSHYQYFVNLETVEIKSSLEELINLLNNKNVVNADSSFQPIDMPPPAKGDDESRGDSAEIPLPSSKSFRQRLREKWWPEIKSWFQIPEDRIATEETEPSLKNSKKISFTATINPKMKRTTKDLFSD